MKEYGQARALEILLKREFFDEKFSYLFFSQKQDNNGSTKWCFHFIREKPLSPVFMVTLCYRDQNIYSLHF